MKVTKSLQAKNISDHIQTQAERLSSQLNAHMFNTFSPESTKTLRSFSASEASDLIGTSMSNLRKLHAEGKIIDVEPDARGRRTYTATQIHDIRAHLAKEGRNSDNFKPGRRSPNDKMMVIGISNFKGGSCKTSTTINLAHKFALDGYRVLCVDMDPQASLTTMFGYRPEIAFTDAGTIYDVLNYSEPVPLSNIIKKTYFPNLDLAPSGILLSEYETETALMLSQKKSGQVPFYNRLSQAFATVDDDYDVVFIDCPPQIGFLTLTALMSATGVITPIIPAMYDVASMAQFLQLSASLMRAFEEQNVKTEWAFMKFLISRYEPHDSAQQQMASFLQMIFGEDIMQNTILKSTAVLDAANTQETIYEIDPSSVNRKTLERALTSMNAAADEVHDLIQAAWGRDVPQRENL